MEDIVLVEGNNRLDVALKSEAMIGTGEVWGIVLESMRASPLAGVTITANGYETRTDSNGNYRISGMVPDIYTFTFSKAGYRQVEPVSLSVKADDSLYLRQILVPS